MSEVVKTVVETLPYTAPAAGAALGILDGYRATGVLARNRQKFIEHNGPDLLDHEDQELANTVESPASTISVRRRLTSPVVGALAATYALAGFGAAVAWQGEDSEKTPLPNVVFVGDHSGATGLGNKPAVNMINRTAKILAQDKKISASAILASNGKEFPAKITNVQKNEPIGPAFMGNATELGISLAKEKSAEARGETGSAVIVATHGNSIGSSKKVIEKANSADSKVAVYVLNTYKDTPSERINGFKKVAKQTGGKYVETVNEDTFDKVADKLSPAAEIPVKEEDKWPLKLLSAVLAASAVIATRKYARKLPISRI